MSDIGSAAIMATGLFALLVVVLIGSVAVAGVVVWTFVVASRWRSWGGPALAIFYSSALLWTICFITALAESR